LRLEQGTSVAKLGFHAQAWRPLAPWRRRCGGLLGESKLLDRSVDVAGREQPAREREGDRNLEVRKSSPTRVSQRLISVGPRVRELSAGHCGAHGHKRRSKLSARGIATGGGGGQLFEGAGHVEIRDYVAHLITLEVDETRRVGAINHDQAHPRRDHASGP